MGLACFLGSRKSLQSHKQIGSFASFDVASSYRKFENTRAHIAVELPGKQLGLLRDIISK